MSYLQIRLVSCFPDPPFFDRNSQRLSEYMLRMNIASCGVYGSLEVPKCESGTFGHLIQKGAKGHHN